MWGRRGAWLLIFLAALCMYLFENQTQTRIILAAAVLVPILSALAALVPRTRLSARLEVPETLNRGEETRCSVTLENGGALPLARVRCTVELRNLLTGEVGETRLEAAIGGRGRAELAFTVTPPHYGKLELRVTALERVDLFGLFARAIPCAAKCTALVPPQVHPVELSVADSVEFLPDSAHYSTQRAGHDPSETFRIRSYVPGDPVRQIHWKLSQKTDTVLVRDFGLPVVQEMLLLLETTGLYGTPIPPGELDDMLALLFSLSSELLAREAAHTVGWQDNATGDFASHAVHSADDLPALRDALLTNRSGTGERTVAGCCARDLFRGAYAHVAVITPYLTPDLSALFQGNRVTALVPRRAGAQPGQWEDGVDIITYTGRELADGALRLTL